ncbi:NADH:flavin oxidoreductase/NADH oxidase family protein [Chengkuizengella axinellae]|uniref:NADH:flavin oxidoreductase/NADH oxidase family protein n=1 Tax=Chengkuizengella axinellae TaxID=3064388 RepID=A0ABT9IUG3_9BACL|nr:NADH:flavin oxidoreductase/NADH oxidase family protein [Chengkuizengella sp. 2205SS18-9]MDP5272989.1 NADH:flavin oxidoreductase/NADH oxidase family protein [Chengkuizengella sp. 2205SS18-9]
MESVISNNYILKNGVSIKNRILKSAMSEALGNHQYLPTEGLYRLYEQWADGGTGLLITGNVMIDRKALGEPRNVVVEDDKVLPFLEKWAEKGTKNNTQLWMQLNHPGKQAFKGAVKESVAPSAIPFEGKISRFFHKPREMKKEEIVDSIKRFGYSALLAKKSGFTGVQIHGAHGYLISQFLSPRHNQRKDEWGGDINGRMKFLIEIYREIRKQTGESFPISVKLNSADFMKAGFTEDESIYTALMLEKEGVDLLEISGGTYESSPMAKMNQKSSTKIREAYFMDYAEKLRQTVKIPLCVTGGFRSVTGMENALNSNAMDFVGLARPLAIYPDLPNLFANQSINEIRIDQRKTGIRFIDELGMLEITWYAQQLRRLAKGRKTRPQYPVIFSFLQALAKNGKEIFIKQRSGI